MKQRIRPFSHTEWQIPEGWSGSKQAACDVSGALFFTHAAQCRVSRCIIEHVGGYGLEISEGCLDVEITRNQISEIGTGGVKVWHKSLRSVVDRN